jgi:hypothetical protein
MSKDYYKHFQTWEKRKLEKLIDNKPTCRPIYGMTPHGWDINSLRWLVNISRLAFQLHKERKTIKNELMRGRYWTLTNSIAHQSNTLSYSQDASDQHKLGVIKKRRRQNTKTRIWKIT